MWWHMLLMALKRLRQEDHTFEDNLNYIKRLPGLGGRGWKRKEIKMFLISATQEAEAAGSQIHG